MGVFTPDVLRCRIVRRVASFLPRTAIKTQQRTVFGVNEP